MEEIASKFGEELQELLDRYKDHLTNPQIMRVAQHIFHETLSPEKHPERLKQMNLDPSKIIDIPDNKMKHCFKGEWKSTEELEGSAGRDAVAGISDKVYKVYKVYKGHCSSQQIAKANCDGDIRHCKNACGKLRMNKTTISDAPEFHIGEYFDDQEIDLDSSMMHL